MDIEFVVADRPMQIQIVGLHMQVRPIQTHEHTIEILRAEWWAETPHFVLLRYALDGAEQTNAFRLDMDKRTIIDDFDDPKIKAAVLESVPSIWRAVASAQQSYNAAA